MGMGSLVKEASEVCYLRRERERERERQRQTDRQTERDRDRERLREKGINTCTVLSCLWTHQRFLIAQSSTQISR
jgi:hypothetical protein